MKINNALDLLLLIDNGWIPWAQRRGLSLFQVCRKCNRPQHPGIYMLSNVCPTCRGFGDFAMREMRLEPTEPKRRDTAPDRFRRTMAKTLSKGK
jgi:hypothetical protein